MADTISYRDQQELSRRTTCKHFLGADRVCRAGVDIRAHVGGPNSGWGRRMPCQPDSSLTDERDIVPCEKYAVATDEEIAAEETEFQKAFDAIRRGMSPCCNASLDERQVIQTGRYKGSGPRFCSKCGQFVMRSCSRG